MVDIWRDVLLHTIREVPSKEKEGTGFGLWVIQRVCNDRSYNVTVRGGAYRTNAATKEKIFPREGLTLFDFNAIGPIYLETIKPLLITAKGSAVPVAGSGPAADAPASGKIEECPF